MYETPLQLGDPFPQKKAMPNFREHVSHWNQLLQLRETAQYENNNSHLRFSSAFTVYPKLPNTWWEH